MIVPCGREKYSEGGKEIVLEHRPCALNDIGIGKWDITPELSSCGSDVEMPPLLVTEGSVQGEETSSAIP
jgi:hypothetical protein